MNTNDIMKGEGKMLLQNNVRIPRKCMSTRFQLQKGGGKGNNSVIYIDKNKLGLVCFLVLTFFMLFFGTKTYAVDSAAGALGACNIVNPSGTSYQYVYFGNGSSSYSITGPIQFRVLSTTANGTLRASEGGSTCSNAALFMMSEYGLCNHVWDSNSGQTWKNSSIQTWLNSESSGPLKDCFTTVERGAIAYTTTNVTSAAKNWYRSGSWYVAGQYSTKTNINNLSDDRLFLLSAEEVTNTAYGFNFTDNSSRTDNGYAYTFAGNDICKLGNSASGWWLRSACSNYGYHVAYVDSSGESDNDGSSLSYAVRFALNVHLSSIIYASNASTTGASASTFKAIDAIARTSAPSSASGYKLTIQNTDRPQFSVSPSSITAVPGGKIAVHYTNAKTGSNEYICGIIKKNDNSNCYHGRFAPYGSSSTNITSSYASGDIVMDLPSLSTGTYKLIMYSETNAGTAKKTNEGRCANEITLKIESSLSAGSGPTISNVYKKGDGSYYRFTATDSNGLFMVTNSAGNSVFRTILGPSGTYNMPFPSGTTEFRVYNMRGRYSLVNGTNNTIMTDSMAPSINNVSYNGGNYTIDVTDSDSGIWKITDSTGGTIIADYS